MRSVQPICSGQSRCGYLPNKAKVRICGLQGVGTGVCPLSRMIEVAGISVAGECTVDGNATFGPTLGMKGIRVEMTFFHGSQA